MFCINCATVCLIVVFRVSVKLCTLLAWLLNSGEGGQILLCHDLFLYLRVCGHMLEVSKPACLFLLQ